jgi:phage shock protein C
MSSSSSQSRKLQLSDEDKVIAGVCGGLAAFTGIDPWIIRIGFIVLTLLGGHGVLVYLALWLLLPRRSNA